MEDQEHYQLPLPEDYQKQKIAQRLFCTIQFNITILNLSILVQECTSLDVLYQSVFIVLALIFLMFTISYWGYIRTDVRTPIVKYPYVLMAAGLGIVVILQIPYYSIAFSAVTLFSLLKMLRKKKIVKTNNFVLSKYDEIIFNFNLVYLSVILLVHQRILEWDFRYVLIPYWALIIFLTVSMNSFFYSSFRNDRIFKRSIYRSDFRQKMGFIMINLHLLCFMVFPLHAYFGYNFVTPLLLGCLGLNLVQSFICLYYFEEIILLSLAPKYSQSQTIFRIYPRVFLEAYSEPKCLRNINQLDNCCLLCDQKATVVKFPCGHLTNCQKCEAKLRVKYFVFCMICNIGVTKKKVLIQPQKNRIGYLRKFFIEKKLVKNQYLCR